MARSRHKDALAIQQGACNPIAITNTLKEHIAEFQNEPGYTGFDQMREDPALRLIVHQLAHLFRVSSTLPMGEYLELEDHCKDKANEHDRS